MSLESTLERIAVALETLAHTTPSVPAKPKTLEKPKRPKTLEQPTPEPEPEPEPEPVAASTATPEPEPVAASTATLSEVMAYGTSVAELPTGKACLQSIGAKFGVTKISTVAPEHYGAVIDLLRQHLVANGGSF